VSESRLKASRRERREGEKEAPGATPRCQLEAVRPQE
jgi:hypothetical protein